MSTERKNLITAIGVFVATYFLLDLISPNYLYSSKKDGVEVSKKFFDEYPRVVNKEKRFNYNAFGIALAVGSIYFVSVYKKPNK